MLKTILASGLLLLAVQIRSQEYYELEIKNETYSELTGDTDLPFEVSEGGAYYHDNTFTFPVFGDHIANFRQQMNPVPSRGCFIAPQGYLAIYESPDYVNTVVLQPFSNSGFDYAFGSSKLSVKTEGTTGERIVKFQIKDVIYQANSANKANMQVWFHEKDSVLSYHYGPITVPGAASLNSGIGLFIYDATLTNFVEHCSASGDPSNPTLVSGTPPGGVIPEVNGWPGDGVSYYFRKKAVTTGIATSGTEKINDWQVYPNPVKNQFTLYSQHKGTYEVYNAFGQLVKNIEHDEEGEMIIDVSEWNSGCYIIKASDLSIKRIIVE